MRVFISAGEPSGDLHASHVARDLRKLSPQLEIVGFGGPELWSAGAEILFDLPSLALMGFARVVRHIPKLRQVLRMAVQSFEKKRPDALLLVDYPGFHWHLAEAAKERGIPVYYYCPPQLWGWAPWRVKKLRRLVDHVLCCLPFEEAYYRSQGCPCTLVGHPFFDDLQRKRYDSVFESQLTEGGRPLVALLPGSRNHEVQDNLGQLLRAAALVRKEIPHARFVAACFKREHAEYVDEHSRQANLNLEIHHGKTPEIMRSADCAISVSGSVSLELMYHALPSVMVYQTGWVGYALQAMFRKVKYITLVNLLNAKELHPRDLRLYRPDQPNAEEVLLPEYLCLGDRSKEIAGHIIHWLHNSVARNQARHSLQELKKRVALPGSTQRVAQFLVERCALPVRRSA